LSVAQIPEQVVSRWVDAFNERNLEGMLMALDPGAHFHPLRLSGFAGSYRGHDGVRQWFARLKLSRLEQRFLLADVRGIGEGKVYAVGYLSLAGQRNIARFCALNWLDGRLIVAAHHYLPDPDMIEHLGLIP
jgi:hypothetical protein